jgi:hypothetical protein
MWKNALPADIRVSIAVLRQLFSYLDSLDVDKEAFLRSIQVEPAILDSPDAYSSLQTYLLIQDEAAHYWQSDRGRCSSAF